MTDRRRLIRLAGGAITALVLVSAVAPTMGAADAELVQSTDEPETTEPDPTDPETTQPDPTEPDTTEPEAVEAQDESTDSTVAVIAVIGFGALVALAGWWMVQRRDEDDSPHPPTPDGPLPGQDLL